MVTRKINNIEIDINEKESNELYFSQQFINENERFDNDIETIKNAIYSWGNNDSYFPLSILWEITNKCNFHCPFCYINTPLARRIEFQSVDRIKEIIDDLVKMGMLFCTLSGGECLLHPSFKEIYMYLKKRGVLVSIFSNGMLLDEKLIELFNEYKPYKIEISIYGCSEEAFYRATGSQEQYNNVLDNIVKLKKLGIRLRCKTPITSLTDKEIPYIDQWCKDNNIDYYISDELLDTYYGESNNIYQSVDEIYYETVKNRENSYKKYSKNTFGRKKAWECSAGKYSGVIAADGFFYPCMSCVGIEKYRFSIENGIGECINKYREVLGIEKGENLKFCNGCNHYMVCDKCILSSIRNSEEDLKRNCEHMKELCD